MPDPSPTSPTGSATTPTTGSRPRVAGDREDEILEATLRVLLEVGYDRLTFDAVARAARAGKATLYRRWADKPSLVVDAMVRAKQAPVVEPHDTGSLRGDLMQTFCGHHGIGRSDATELMGSVVTALASDPDFAARFREAFIAPKVAVSSAIYRRAVERGEIAPDTDVEVIAPALAGILLHRSFVLGLPPDDATVARVVDHVILPAVGLPRPSPPEAAHPDPGTSPKTNPDTSPDTSPETSPGPAPAGPHDRKSTP